jgi:anti-sigma factor RsiW
VTDVHVDTDLSAYLDGELAPADRALVDAHLGGCERCRARLSELRATASLISALPSARPSRSLVPVIRERFNWLRPVRSLSAVASGAFLFVFLVTAVARTGSGLGGGTTAFGPAAAPAAAPAATAAQLPAPTNVPAPAAAPAADAARAAATSSPTSGFSVQGTAAPTAAPKAVEQATATTFFREVQPSSEALRTTRGIERGPSPLSDPFLWLGLAVIAAVGAIAAHWRLRTT